MRKTYQQGKVEVREIAINWQMEAAYQDYSYGDIAEAGEWFYRYGKRYGLLREFRENGIPC